MYLILSTLLTTFSIVCSFIIQEPPEHYSGSTEVTSLNSCGDVLSPITEELMNCPGCLDRKMNELSNEELQKLKFDILKQQILEKLQLKEAPCVKLPKPPLQSILAATQDMNVDEPSEEDLEDPEDTQDIVVFANNDNFNCSEEDSCVKFKFLLPEDADIIKLQSVDLWFYKKNESVENELIVGISNSSNPNEFSQQLIYLEEQYADMTPGWKKFNLTTELSSLSLKDLTAFNIKTYGAEVATTGEEKPFLILHFKNANKLSNRNRRSLNCHAHSTSCCKESLMISFAAIGWDNWILFPERYSANFCKGQCVHDISIYRYYHSVVKHAYLKFNKTAAATLGMNLCCTPSHLSSLSMIYRDANGTLYRKNLQNMIVDACDCT